MNNRNFIGGFTLLELLVATVVISIIASIAAPSLSHLISRSQRHASVTEIIALINLARNTAIMEQRTVTLCPLDESNECSHDWSGTITVFRDPEADKALNDPGQVIRVGQPPDGGHWSANTSSRPYFRFMPTGIANYAIGNMIWCPGSGDMTTAAQIIVNRGGRVRISEDSDGDGVVEDGNGEAITCT